jgi:pilus assembly protein Flp/PilA
MRGGDKTMKWLAKFLKEESGATAVEYGIMVAAIAAVIIVVVFAIGRQVNNSFSLVNSALAS